MTSGNKSEKSKPSQTNTVKKTAKKLAANTKNENVAAEIKKYEDEIKVLNEKVLRALAEVENTRRRAERDIQDMRTFAITSFARDMLTIQDNLVRALGAIPEEMKKDTSYKGFIEGIEMTERELLNTFERHGIQKITPKGEAFDHNLHQAMFEVETDDAKPGTVLEVIQEGYVIKERLLRPAMVGVAKKIAPKDGIKKQNK